MRQQYPEHGGDVESAIGAGTRHPSPRWLRTGRTGGVSLATPCERLIRELIGSESNAAAFDPFCALPLDAGLARAGGLTSSPVVAPTLIQQRFRALDETRGHSCDLRDSKPHRILAPLSLVGSTGWLWHRLLGVPGRAVSEFGRLRQRARGRPQGDRRPERPYVAFALRAGAPAAAADSVLALAGGNRN